MCLHPDFPALSYALLRARADNLTFGSLPSSEGDIVICTLLEEKMKHTEGNMRSDVVLRDFSYYEKLTTCMYPRRRAIFT